MLWDTCTSNDETLEWWAVTRELEAFEKQMTFVLAELDPGSKGAGIGHEDIEAIRRAAQALEDKARQRAELENLPVQSLPDHAVPCAERPGRATPRSKTDNAGDAPPRAMPGSPRDHTDKSVLTAIFDRRANESIPLTQGHEHEQGRAERLAEETEPFRKAIKANPELAARVDPDQLLDAELGNAMEEQIRTEVKEITRAI